MSVRYIGQKLAQQIDEELMSASGAFSLDQLMELAGLACAQAFHKTFPPTTHRKVMICCGPGNQGGDGLVAARHLHHFKYKPTIYLPKPGSKDIYKRLLRQCENLKIPVISETGKFEEGLKESDAILDAVFGFSFAPPIRKPFDSVLRAMKDCGLPILSVDIPSGWHVEDGPQVSPLTTFIECAHQQPLYTQEDDQGRTESIETFTPEALISLTVPKLGVREFKGQHWLGGRFVPDELEKKFELNIPEYPGTDGVVQLPPYKE